MKANNYICIWNPSDRTFRQIAGSLTINDARKLKDELESDNPTQGFVILELKEGVRE